MSKDVQDVIDLLGQIEQDFSVPKNIRTRVKNAMTILGEDGKTSVVKFDKAIELLDSVSGDSNLPTYTRTQIWHIVSLLESNK